MSQYEVTILFGYGVKTTGDLLKKTEDDLAFMRDKKGISYSAKFTQVREKIQKHYNSLFENKQ